LYQLLMSISSNSNILEIEGDKFYELNPPFNFAGLEPRYSKFRNSWAVIVPVPYDATTTFQAGTRNGPPQIIQASQQLELYDEETDTEVFRKGICTLSPILPDVTSPENMVKKVQKVISWIKKEGKFPVLLGGEHLVAVGSIKGVNESDDFTIIHFDAHADLRESYQGSRFSNACVMRLVADLDFVSVGVRSLSREEHLFMKEEKIHCVYARDVVENRDYALKRVLESAGKKTYLTIDLDVLDPSVMPSVGTPEPGGISWWDLLYFLRAICRESRVIGFDVVELLPQPGNIAPDFLAAKLVYKILSYVAYYLDKKSNL